MTESFKVNGALAWLLCLPLSVFVAFVCALLRFCNLCVAKWCKIPMLCIQQLNRIVGRVICCLTALQLLVVTSAWML